MGTRMGFISIGRSRRDASKRSRSALISVSTLAVVGGAATLIVVILFFFNKSIEFEKHVNFRRTTTLLNLS